MIRSVLNPIRLCLISLILLVILLMSLDHTPRFYLYRTSRENLNIFHTLIPGFDTGLNSNLSLASDVELSLFFFSLFSFHLSFVSVSRLFWVLYSVIHTKRRH